VGGQGQDSQRGEEEPVKKAVKRLQVEVKQDRGDNKLGKNNQAPCDDCTRDAAAIPDEPLGFAPDEVKQAHFRLCFCSS